MNRTRSKFFVYLFLSAFFIASYTTIDTYLSNSTSQLLIIQTGVRIIWGGAGLICLLLGIITLGKRR